MFYIKKKDLKLSTKLPLKLVKVKIKPDTVESYSIFPLTFIYSTLYMNTNITLVNPPS